MGKKTLRKKFLGILLTSMLAVTGAMPVAAFSDETVVDEPAKQEESLQNSENNAEAQAYLMENYITNNKVITTGGDGVVKSADGLTYTIGTKTPSGSSISTIRLKMEGSSSAYKTGWYIDENNPYIFYKNPSSTTSRSITSRPATDYSFTATLKLFASDTEADAIDNGSAEALATQDFTFILKADAAKSAITFKAVDKATGSEVSGANVKVEYNWSTVYPESNGSYSLETDKTYTVTAKADGYKDYTNYDFKPEASGEVKLPMEKKELCNIKFDVRDAAGNKVEGATISVKEGYYTTITPQADGSYNLTKGTSYNYTVSAENYKSATGTISPTGDETKVVELTKQISVYTVKFNPEDSATGNAVTNPNITVTYDEEDDWDGEVYTYPVSPQADGTYKLFAGTEYTYKITADRYKKAEGTFTPSGEDDSITKTVKMDKDVAIDPADQQKVDAVKEAFEKEIGALRPTYGPDSNIAKMVLTRLSSNSSLDMTGVTVELASTGDSDYVKDDGTICYVKNDLNTWGINSKNVTCTFKFKCNGAEAVSRSRTVTVCWDRDFFYGKMKEEANSLTWDKIKKDNTNIDAVETDITLPQIVGTSARDSWSKVTWESSDPSIIAIEATGYDSLVDPKLGKVTPKEEDTEVTLTATLIANDSALNSMVESPENFGTVTKKITVKVKGTGSSAPTEEGLQALLDKYYTADMLKDAVTDKTLDTSKVEGDIQLPRYTRIQDENGTLVFNNKEITVSADRPELITINGYRANVDLFAGKKEVEDVNLIITFTRKGVTVSKKIPLKVMSITDEVLDRELAMMDIAKANYFNGINDGKYKNADSVMGDLHPFEEMTLDNNGNPVWIYDIKDVTNVGIKPVGYFEDPWEMEAAGYNRFKSSNDNIVRHENLLVTRPEKATKVKITSWLSSAKYGKYAPAHPENAKLQRLYKQEVSAEITVLGVSDPVPSEARDSLAKTIEDAKAFRNSIKEGTKKGKYPRGSIATLNTAIATAEKIVASAGSTDEEMTAAEKELAEVVRLVAESVIAVDPPQEEENNPATSAAAIAANTNTLNKGIKATWSGSNVRLSWGKVSGATGYEVYGAKCGKKYAKVATVKGTTTSYNMKKLSGKKTSTRYSYKAYVKAYHMVNGKKTYIGTSYGMHTVGSSNKYTNPNSISVSKKSVTLSAKKTSKIKASVKRVNGKKQLLPTKHIAKVRCFSTNTKVATVTTGGTITAKAKGSCTVYVVAANGVKTTVKVTVK